MRMLLQVDPVSPDGRQSRSSVSDLMQKTCSFFFFLQKRKTTDDEREDNQEERETKDVAHICYHTY